MANATMVLYPTTARRQADSSFSVNVGGNNPAAIFLATTNNNAFNASPIIISNQEANDAGAARDGIAPGGTLTATIAITKSGTQSNITGVTLTGDGGAIQTALWINGPITSTGPLGDLTLQAPQGLTGNVTAPRIFGSISAPNGAIAGTIQTTGVRTDPLTGQTQAGPADFGQVITNTSGTPTGVTTVFGHGAISGQVISRGALISQVSTDGNLTGLVAAVGAIGVALPSGGSTARFGGVSVTGTTSGQIVAFGDILGNIATTNLTGGRIAAQGAIKGNLTVSASANATSAIVAEGEIGDSAFGTSLTLTNASGLVAAGGAIRFGGAGAPAAAAVFNNVGSAANPDPNAPLDIAAIDAVFSDASGQPLTSFDVSGLDLALLSGRLLPNLAKLRVTTNAKGKVLADS